MFDPDEEDREERRHRRRERDEDREPEDYEPRLSAREEDFAAAEYFAHRDRIHDR